MKKQLGLLLAAVLVMMVGCASEQPEQTETVPPTTEWVLEDRTESLPYEDVELVFQSSWNQDTPEASVLAQAAEVFSRRTGGKVSFVWPGSEKEKPDIFQTSEWELDAVDPESVLVLEDYAQAADYESCSIPALRNRVRDHFGSLIAIPQVPCLTGFFYNRQLIKDLGIGKLPGNFAEFTEFCRLIKNGGAEALTLDIDRAWQLFLHYQREYIEESKIAELLENGGWWEYPQAAEQIWSFVNEGLMTPRTPAPYPDGQNRMGTGNSALVYGSSNLCREVGEYAMTPISWGMFPVPAAEEGSPVIYLDMDVVAIAADCENPQAAFDFVMLLCTGELDQLRADLTCSVPADPRNLSPIAGAFEAMENAFPAPLMSLDPTEKQKEVMTHLWQGWYEEPIDFLRALDRLRG